MRTTRTSGGRDSDGQEQEDFARAVDSSLREVSDRNLDRELAIVATLRQVGATAGPNPLERDRMRRRIMTEFSDVVHDGSSPVLSLQAAANQRWHRHWIPDETRGRLVVAAAASLCLLMALSGMSVLLSRDALPGDALYTFKRTAESAELGLTFGDQPKALKHLEFAAARVSEIEVVADLAGAAGNWSAGQGKVLRALDDFDSDTTAGARLLTALAANGQPNSLSGLRSWVQQQNSRLESVRSALPLSTSARLDSTLRLLDRVVARISALSERSNCVTITSGTRDDLGLLPARDVCKPVPIDGASTAVPLPDGAGVTPDSPPNVIMPPSLLQPPAANSVPLPAQDDQGTPAQLPTTRSPGDVLPDPDGAGSEPARPLPANDSSRPSVPLPPGILLPSLLPPE
ncbi:MAG: DUF5667 domain-containing protein [Actinomycetota bacterium]|nr:DUF5667 domain-containing protein [Actinomycetota bacterium]